MLVCAALLAAACLPSSASAAHAHIAGLLRWTRARPADAPCDPAWEVCVDKFVDELPLPATAARRRRDEADAHEDVYDLDMASCDVSLHSQLPPTRMYCYGSSIVGGKRGHKRYSTPGPTIEATVGIPVRATFTNNLPVEHLLPVDPAICGGVAPGGRAVVHLHGGHQEWESDGDAYAWWTPTGERGPDAPAKPGHYLWANSRSAAPLFYHDHAACVTRLNVWAGLGGLYALREAGAPAAGCGGVSEFPLVLRDIALRADASLAYPVDYVPEMFGNLSLVNGALWPRHTVPAAPVAYRLLVAANARFYSLALFFMDEATGEADLARPGPAITVTGADGGALPAPVLLSGRLVAAPAERFDLRIDFSGYEGARLILHNDAATPYAGPGGNASAGVPLPTIMAFDVDSARAQPRAGAEAPCPTPTPAPTPAPPAAKPKNRRIDLTEHFDDAGRLILLLEGKRCDDPITIMPELQSTETWEFINTTPDEHPMHVHLVAFQTEGHRTFDVAAYLATGELVYTGELSPPAAHEAGPRDVVKVPNGTTTRVRMTFERDGLWMLHCHILEHEDYDMMRFFRVVASEEQLAADARLADSQSRVEAIISGRASRGGAHRHPRAGAKGAAL